MNWLNGIENPGVTGWIEILILAIIFYSLLKLFRGTRGSAVFTGLMILLAGLILVTELSNLTTLSWLLQKLVGFSTFALIVIFHPEIRRALARIGRQENFVASKARKILADPIADAVQLLAARKIGALIAIERSVETKAIQDTGTPLNSEVTAELLAALFYPGAPLHDGGVIISEDRVAAAGCVFPLTQNDDIARNLGTRHRAAIGMTEESDTIVVVVSEETGVISIAYNGRLKRGFDGAHLRRILSTFLGRETGGLRRMTRRNNSERGQMSFIFGEGSDGR
ncbi:diadenylate cyclase CdaA [Tichowtungia aerotolerans]|uniref:Diadenylate cyclase n=1 Tax=Tichowtungia aerotolerans TaxID=2697043 RepID=A0A6P1M215_9BACT|nr:diadenylate cyclase CdaA [Tichowtungia aerotolerans]QHI68630.1 TIGR00159 family protein [Tichowtungia aerotolerans]